ncbi:outer membrane protein assembly factor BamE [Hydrogenophaga sp. IBVHS1]|jgi:outer membrane protein assembly factor BamE|uniref:outer membrane protein assembly factor BamE n=1 Tax=unclassified Hydrogenophaga TaxID=2610897 RepID=UPI000A31F602|nr:outer membrane protein assembly factor BamE [Hydrogenophaga sp. IBVHS1]
MHPSGHHGIPAQNRSRPLRVFACALALVGLGACSGYGDGTYGLTSLVTPYKIDILQGNVVTREQSQLLKPGMTRPQVRDVLGSPLLTSVFHAERWDYVFTYKRQGQEPQRRKLTAFFKGDVLDRIEADELPSETEFVASLDSRRKPGKVLPLEATPEQLKAFQERNPGTPVTPPPSAPANANYPPLEGAGVTR